MGIVTKLAVHYEFVVKVVIAILLIKILRMSYDIIKHSDIEYYDRNWFFAGLRRGIALTPRAPGYMSIICKMTIMVIVIEAFIIGALMIKKGYVSELANLVVNHFCHTVVKGKFELCALSVYEFMMMISLFSFSLTIGSDICMLVWERRMPYKDEVKLSFSICLGVWGALYIHHVGYKAVFPFFPYNCSSADMQFLNFIRVRENTTILEGCITVINRMASSIIFHNLYEYLYTEHNVTEIEVIEL